MDSSYFETRYTPHPGRSRVWKAICEYLQRFVGPADTVLDVGAGYCDFINQIHAGSRYAVDINPDTARWCASEVRFVEASPIDSINLPEHSINVIMVSNLLEHLTPAQCCTLFDRFDHLLAPNGKVIAIQPNYFYSYRRYWDDFTHVRAFSHVSLRDFFASRNFRIIANEPRFLPFSLKSRLPKSYWMTRLYLASFWRPFAGQMLVVAER